MDEMLDKWMNKWIGSSVEGKNGEGGLIDGQTDE